MPTAPNKKNVLYLYTMIRRKFIGDIGKATLATVVGGGLINNIMGCATTNKNSGTNNTLNYNIDFTQKPLAYNYNALNQYIDEATMTIHHTKHAAAYLKNAKDEWDELIAKKNWDKYPTIIGVLNNIKNYSPKMRNNLGGHYNHEMFWQCLTPNQTAPTEKLTTAINTSFGSIDAFKIKFNDAAKSRFGSGWAWLSIDANKKLVISSTPNQDNPLMNVAEQQGSPILCLDVWEHAYYLKYQNKRADYIAAFWNIVNWKYVESLYNALA